MIKKILLGIMFILATTLSLGHCGAENSTADEISHYAAGGVAGGLVAYYLPKHIPYPMRVVLGTAAGMLVGTLKEGLYDDHFDTKDLGQWGMGAAVSSAIISIPFSL